MILVALKISVEELPNHILIEANQFPLKNMCKSEELSYWPVLMLHFLSFKTVIFQIVSLKKTDECYGDNSKNKIKVKCLGSPLFYEE